MAGNEFNAVPPHNEEAERATLGALLINKDAAIQVMDILQPEDFYFDSNRLIFDAMVELFNNRTPLDVVNLSNRLTEKGHLDAIGGRATLVDLAKDVPTASNVVHYASIVQKKSTLRKLINAAHKMIGFGFDEEANVEDLLDQAEQELFGVSQRYLRNNFIPLHSALTEAFERIDKLHKNAGELRGITTGFKVLDDKLGGLQKSDLVVLAARPSMGKSSLALDIARNVAIKAKVPVGVVSLEMSKEQIIDRMLCAEAGVDLWKLRTGKLSDDPGNDEFPRIGEAMGVLSEAPVYIDDSPGANVMEIRTKARRLQMEKGLGLLVLDYLQLMEGRSGTDNRTQEVSEISRALKGIARELNIPVLAISQLSRAVELNNPPIPKLSHLRESGAIEQDADVVMFIYREDYYKKDTDRKNITDIIIAKHRNGPTGQCELFFDMNKASFRNLDASRTEAPPV